MRPFRTQTKLLVLMGLVVCAFLCGLGFLYRLGEKQAGILLEEKMAEKVSFLNEFIDLYEDPLQTFVFDYSFWDEMISFVQTADSTWGYENIDVSLTTYHADAAWVYKVNGDRVYGAAKTETEALLTDVQLERTFRTSFGRKTFHHYFSYTTLGWLEIRIAPVQPSSDNDRLTQPQGYFVAGKLWTNEYIANLERAVQGNIRITEPGVIPSAIDDHGIEHQRGEIRFTYPLPGPDGRPMAELDCHAKLPLLDTLRTIDRNRVAYIGIFVLGIMFVLMISLHRWVSHPLKYAMEGLRTGDPAVLKRLEKASFEFERIGELVSEYIAQKADLEAEISDRKRSEEELRASETRYRLIAEQIGQMIYDWDYASGGILWAGAIEKITGYSPEEYRMVGIEEWRGMLHPDDRTVACDLLAAAAEAVGRYNVEYRLRRKDGSYIYIESNGVFIAGETGKAYRMLGTMKDVTERKQGEATLRDREQLLRATLESTADGILVVGRDSVVTHWNGRFAELWRIPQEIIDTKDDGQLLQFVVDQLKYPDVFLSKVRELYESSDESFDILEFIDGRYFERYSCPLIKEGQAAGRVWSFRDITPRLKDEETRQQLQEKLDRAQRYESLGLLAGGVAHDLNNMLGPIGGYAELLAQDLPPDSKIAARVKKIIKSSEDAAAVIQDLLTLARRGRYEFRTTDLNQVVSHYLESAGFERCHERYPNISMQTDYSPDGSFIEGSESHLLKVIMNLVTNAHEAMPSGGTISIRTENIRLGRLFSGYGPIPEGDYAVLRIKDSGTGIAKEDIEKIFEPYFSKKQMGQSGSGLGLAVVYGIVKDHHGYYDVFSQPGAGTEFVMYFPLSEASVRPEAVFSGAARGGTETVLVVDDSAEQRELAREIVTSLGYTVHTVENGHQAASFVARNPVDIIVLDMIMEPGFDGLDTYREISKIRPGQKAVVVSGFSETDRVREMQRLGTGSYLKKPYRVDDLGRALRKELDRQVLSR